MNTVQAVRTRTRYWIRLDPTIETVVGVVDQVSLDANPRTGAIENLVLHYVSTIIGGPTDIATDAWREHPDLRAAILEAMTRDFRRFR